MISNTFIWHNNKNLKFSTLFKIGFFELHREIINQIFILDSITNLSILFVHKKQLFINLNNQSTHFVIQSTALENFQLKLTKSNTYPTCLLTIFTR
ncbi:hypothetical protein T190607A02C_20566 [Tenacibaculum sp. 190524A02b]